ncbi:hypothetical protein BC936DRAFT_150173 [Jimgerdemannia flammicorona]|uniref:Uncharacterized protein n=1 Tax=Jimgerdemannia flammicorona TaxID=994334 RepID=A0A433DJM5_9FUNG|nr:hypothetical protein BC936DRAFT_150173 [Jimgerdemannia flammicorona]
MAIAIQFRSACSYLHTKYRLLYSVISLIHGQSPRKPNFFKATIAHTGQQDTLMRGAVPRWQTAWSSR